MKPRVGDDLLGAELLQEKAWNLGRLARRLENALAALAAHDRAATATRAAVPQNDSAAPAGDPPTPRRDLLDDASEALFLYVVQREVMGLRGTAAALDEMRVPREVRLRMAPRSVLVGRLRQFERQHD
jgi:hypothetical protein